MTAWQRKFTIIAMRSEDFIRERKPSWDRLQALMEDVERVGYVQMGKARVFELARLYREATSDLAQARTHFPDHQIAAFLNHLVARAHGKVYTGKALPLQAIPGFFMHEFPALFRETWRYSALGALALFLPAILSFMVIKADPSLSEYFLPQFFKDSIEQRMEEDEHWADISPETGAMFSSYIMVNNIQVSFYAFGLGMFLGIGSLLILARNGIMLGAVAGVVNRAGADAVLWSFVVSHGVIELTCICIAGGAGFMLGSGVLFPGRHSRRDALVINATRAAKLIIGICPLLVIAGLIEGFISPLKIPAFSKFLFAIIPAVALVLYLNRGGRDLDKPREASY